MPGAEIVPGIFCACAYFGNCISLHFAVTKKVIRKIAYARYFAYLCIVKQKQYV